MTTMTMTTTASPGADPSVGDGAEKNGRPRITTVIFDVDDTLYDIGTGFSDYRNTHGVTSFMVDRLHFPSKEEAQALRDVYFERYHSSAKGLAMAEAEGKLPPLPPGVTLPAGRTNRFDPADLDRYWEENLDYSLLGGPDPECVATFRRISTHPRWKLNVVAFSNGPRRYVARALREMGLAEFFPPERLFAVNDVLPHCKPSAESFEVVLKAIGARAEECVMVEDSMKNVRAAKALGMKTVLITGRGRRGDQGDRADAPDESDPSVDAAIEVAAEIGDVLQGWLGP